MGRRLKGYGGKESLGVRCEVLQFVGPDELIALHGHGDFEGSFDFGLATADYLAEAANAHRRCAAGQGDDVLDLAARLDAGTRQEADASGTDVARLFGDANPLRT